jgi:hypothetical protein
MSDEATAPKRRSWGFQPGKSGNPAGRPKRARHKLGDAFLHDLAAHWQANGTAALDKLAETHSHDYVKIIASLLPKEAQISHDPFDGVDDEELGALIAAARADLAVHLSRRAGDKDPREPQPAGDLPAVR